MIAGAKVQATYRHERQVQSTWGILEPLSRHLLGESLLDLERMALDSEGDVHPMEYRQIQRRLHESQALSRNHHLVR